jgi:hypothetical protein
MTSCVDHVLSVALRGHTLPAADHMLVSDEWAAKPADVTQRVAAALREAFAKPDPAGRRRITHTLLRIGMNLVGQEVRTLRFDPDRVAAAVASVTAALAAMEKADAAVVRETLDAVLADMRSVNAGDSLPAQLAQDIAPTIAAAESRAAAFVGAFGKVVDGCIYTVMSRERVAKFGNDYARGLEYLRHLGYVQVSTNPVLAAKAFDEDAALVEEFRAEARTRADWKADPKKHGDAMALRATLIALWPNLTVFRPLALWAGNMDYMVSFQLNPNIAHLAAESLEDARSAYKQAAAFLTEYDKLLGVPEAGAVRPCIVFKVAGGHAAARTITVELNADGIGTNNTVVYSVAQEARLILDAFEGKARAVNSGKPVTRTYETNMGGRFSSHLREVEAERIFGSPQSKTSLEKATALLAAYMDAMKIDAATREKIASQPIDAKARAVFAFKYLKGLDNPAFLALAEGLGHGAEPVKTLEADIKKAGTMVARRVWKLFYAPAVRGKWTAWLSRKYGVSAEQADLIHGSMDVLPASKRIIEDTTHALGYPNMCHTEFPNHSRAVELFSRKPGFRLADFRDSLSAEYPAEVAQRLNTLPDFVAGYELTAELTQIIGNDVGVTEALRCGTGGLTAENWPKFGPVVKTGGEFREAYDKFVGRCGEIAQRA